MKKALLIASVLFIAVISTACINNIAVQELNNKAAEYMEKGNYEAAVNRLEASIDLDSTMYETYYNLGIAATKAKKYDVAIEALENGLKLKPDYADFYYSLGAAQYEYANELAEDKVEEEDMVKAPAEDDIKKSEELKKSALENLQKYLEMNPQAEDKADVEALINDINKVEEAENKTIVVE
ncbi:MAG: tetratricopeptide repeat protein [Candidatus Gastranaerophilales bacterium]|nr:tetratricopeptide repeat protein [Candidatus Gastranaerophilales bacterium]MCM1073554.1 tetratricopeptide repeat protein [Bacteroides sp.]